MHALVLKMSETMRLKVRSTCTLYVCVCAFFTMGEKYALKNHMCLNLKCA